MKRLALSASYFIFANFAFCQNIVNVYVWGGEIPTSIIKKFEDKTKIKVNFSSYDSNEVLFAKLKTMQDYDVILPSSYFVKKLKNINKLEQLDQTKLPNKKNLAPFFRNQQFKQINQYSVPFTWGATGIFYNKKSPTPPISSWKMFWDKRYYNQLLIMDDPREAFAIALISLGFSPNDKNPQHIKQAYKKLTALQPNIKLLATNAIQGLIIDEDVKLGMAWNGDIYKANSENPNITLSLPKEGFAIWVDCLAILKNAPHRENAYRFIDFLLEAENAKQAMLELGMSSTNQQAYSLLPKKIQQNPLINPPKKVLKHGILLQDLGSSTTKILIEYWQSFKLSF